MLPKTWAWLCCYCGAFRGSFWRCPPWLPFIYLFIAKFTSLSQTLFLHFPHFFQYQGLQFLFPIPLPNIVSNIYNKYVIKFDKGYVILIVLYFMIWVYAILYTSIILNFWFFEIYLMWQHSKGQLWFYETLSQTPPSATINLFYYFCLFYQLHS